MKAVVMAGGKGTRLRPLTCDIPKPMVPIANKPIMEYSIELLRRYNVVDIAVTMAYLPTVITDYFHSGEEWGVNLQYFVEETPLGTGGSVKNAEGFLDDTFIVISGDALTDINIEKAVKYHKMKKSKATLLLKKEPVPLEYGVIITDDEGRIIRFLEKPSWGEVFSDTINTGIYILEPEVLKYFNKGENFDFSKDLFPKLLEDEIPMYGYVIDEYWCDVGDLNSYMQSQFDMLNGKLDYNIDCKEIEKGVWVDEGVRLGEIIKLNPPVYIGKNSTIHENVELGPYTIIGDNCVIGEESVLKRSIAWKNIRFGKRTKASGSIICNDVQIKNRVKLYEGSAIGMASKLMEGVIIKPNIKIWPHKIIEENTIVNQNLIWGTKASKTLFGNRDISGEINIDITPEFASKLGSAFASIMKDDDTYVVSSDDSNAASNIKCSMISGILSTGAGVIDIDKVIISMNRSAVRNYKANGGIHIRIDNSDLNKIYIEFINKNGANINRDTERKIENTFNRDDFERCNGNKIKKPIKIENFASLYFSTGSNISKDISDIKRKCPRMIIGSRSVNILNYAKEFLEHIGCDVHMDFNIESFTSGKNYLNYLSNEVINRRLEMGIFFSENGENIILIDSVGRIIDKEKYIALVSLIILRSGDLNRLIVPNNSPNIVEKMAQEYNVEVVRTKSSPSDIMNNMLNIDSDSEDSLLQYILYFDGIWGAGKIIDFLAERNIALKQLVDDIPDFYFIRKEIECGWKEKGRIIREIIEEHKDMDLELFEGVRISDDKGWTLILPDSERPVFNLYTEGVSEEFAEELSGRYTEKVKKLLENQGQ